MVTVTTTAMFIRHMRVEKAASVAKVPASQISRSANPITGSLQSGKDGRG